MNVMKFATAFALGAVAVALSLAASALLFAAAEYLVPRGDIRMFNAIAFLIALVGIEAVTANMPAVYKWGARVSLVAFALGALVMHFYDWPF